MHWCLYVVANLSPHLHDYMYAYMIGVQHGHVWGEVSMFFFPHWPKYHTAGLPDSVIEVTIINHQDSLSSG